MTLLLTPRYESVAATADTITQYGWYPRESHGGVLRKKLEEQQLSRVRVLRKRLGALRRGEPEKVEIQQLPKEVEESLFQMEAKTRERMEVSLKKALLSELKDVLEVLETAQISQEKVREAWERVQEEELITFMIMM